MKHAHETAEIRQRGILAAAAYLDAVAWHRMRARARRDDMWLAAMMVAFAAWAWRVR